VRTQTAETMQYDSILIEYIYNLLLCEYLLGLRDFWKRTCYILAYSQQTRNNRDIMKRKKTKFGGHERSMKRKQTRAFQL